MPVEPASPTVPLPQFQSRPNCTLCELSTFTLPGGHNGIASSLLPSLPPSPTTPSLVLLGMNPGREECLANENFVGKSGQIVRSVFIPGASLDKLATLYLANVARCYSPYSPTGNTISDTHYKACRAFLLPDLLAMPGRPLHILCLGADPLSHLMQLAGLGKKTQSWGFSHQSHQFSLPGPIDFYLWATYHPAFLLRDRKHIHTSSLHLNLLSSHLRGLTPLPSRPQVEPCRPPVFT